MGSNYDICPIIFYGVNLLVEHIMIKLLRLGETARRSAEVVRAACVRAYACVCARAFSLSVRVCLPLYESFSISPSPSPSLSLRESMEWRQGTGGRGGEALVRTV